MRYSLDVFPRSFSHLGLDNLLPGLTCLAGEEVSIKLEGLRSSRCDGEAGSSRAFKTLSYVALASTRAALRTVT
eukprot:CCRYP_004156-RA/>CCRYP_004156-RA protein AED:0.37 eAED:0.43 QI:0/0/0/1/0/0/2/0/73